MDFLRNVNGKLLRCGCTTGACAAAAAKAAAYILLCKNAVESVTLLSPKGVELSFDIIDACIEAERASCAVRKDGGDDVDVTSGILIYARAEKIAEGVVIEGGEGVGRVTKAGLDQPVGAAAINSTPRRMIAEAVAGVCAEAGYSGGISITISIPEGAALAERTFNPRMGVVGGISVIGTTGIVEPMSNRALIETIRLELAWLRAAGHESVLFIPGNYGESFCKNTLGLSMDAYVMCSNFIGDALDAAAELGFTKTLLIGHIGKLVKLGIGAMNTHSSYGDGRMETLAACALIAGADTDMLKAVLDCAACDAALETLQNAGVLQNTLSLLGRRIGASLARRVPKSVETGFVCFTNDASMRMVYANGILMQSENADDLLSIWRKK